MTLAAVSDAGPLSHLAEIDSFELLATFDTLLVPETVYEEIDAGAVPDRLTDLSYELVEADDGRVGAEDIDAGERAAIAVAKERGVVQLTDDLAARQTASGAGVEVHGSIGVTALGYGRGLLDRDPTNSFMILPCGLCGMSGRRTGADDERLRTDGGRDPDALTDLDGIGPARADKLRDAGFESVADLRAANRVDLVDVLGSDLADRVLEQVGADAQTAGPDTDDAESAEGGPSVPSGAESGPGDDSGPSVPSGGESSAGSDSGPSVPGSGETTTAVDSGESSGQGGRESGSTGGQPADTDSTGAATTGSGGTGTATSTSTSAQGSTQATSDDDALLAGLVSFFIPGVGNMITGDTDRGVIILVLWIVWLIIGWGVIFLGLSFLLTAITLGLGIILVPLIGIVIGLVEFVIHVVAAIDAYRGSKVVDNVTGKVNQVRSD